MNALDLLGRFKDRRVLVVGDVMLDRFVQGRVERISPEAPVPVLKVEREAASLGGAGNVARNVASLGGSVTLVGGKGKDEAGQRLEALLAQEPRIRNALVTAPGAVTTEKVRYLSGRQQVMRADHEAAWEQKGEGAVRSLLAAHDAVVISDYAKGFLAPATLRDWIDSARAEGKPVIVDPKGTEFGRYDGAGVITPNQREAMAVTGIESESDAGTEAAALKLLRALPRLSAVMITRGAAGLSFLARDRNIVHIAARRREVFDVSGAGDTLVAALALALAAGGDLETAARLANLAAGLAVTMPGTAAVTADEVAAELHAREMEGAEKKLATPEGALHRLERWRARGGKVGFTNGCFDLLHPGHIALLTEARANCDHLVVGLNSDASVGRLKGSGRPLQGELARALVLSSLAMVDLVVIFGEDTPENLIRLLRPDLLVKGADYAESEIVGAGFVSAYGGKVLRVPLVPSQSSTGLIERARERP